MAKKPKVKREILTEIDDLISDASMSLKSQKKVVDIITFCEDKAYLNFPGQDPSMALWPMQKIVLKMFYRGTRGNEHLELTDEEIQILHDIARTEELDYVDSYGGFEQVIDKYNRRHQHNTLLLVMGRRSSKTMIVSIIAAYEAYKLLETPEGNPHKFYNMTADKPIAILNVAVSQEQAYDPLFKEIMSRLIRAPYFADKINHDKCNKTTIHLLTDSDKRENAKRRAAGQGILVHGSVVLKSGHSNSASLRGQAAICILFDEFAHFMNSSGKSSGDEVYNALVPSTKQFGIDGKVVLLSDPRGKEGMFWRMFCMAQERELLSDGTINFTSEEILALQLPTWRMNPTKELTKENLERTERARDPVSFSTSFGARFVGEAGAKFFDEQRIEQCIDLTWKDPPVGDMKYKYYMHLDPATTSHNYALVLVHPVPMMNARMEMKRRIVVDKVIYWKPGKDGPVDIMQVENTIKDLCRRFNVAQVSFDTFQSAQTIQRLLSAGIKAKETPFNTGYINDAYGELRNLVNSNDIVLPPHELLIGEMKNLMYKIMARGFKRSFNSKSAYASDDCCDALAGAVYQALKTEVVKTLPRSALVRMR